MDQNALELITADRDAIATNRGFYFQYLSLLKKWVSNYIEDNGKILQSEVGNDIKEIGGKLVFTQLKCYTSTFSLNSREIKKAIYVFFLNYLSSSPSGLELGFEFETNTAVAKNDTLLKDWINASPLAEGSLRDKCNRRIRQLLTEEASKEMRAKYDRIKSDLGKKNKIKAAYDALKQEMDSAQVNKFTAAIKWTFLGQAPDKSIEILGQEIRALLAHPALSGRPVNLLMDVLLSEIYHRSQMPEAEQRTLHIETIKEILRQTDTQLGSKIDYRIMDLFRTELALIHSQIENILNHQVFQDEKIEALDQAVRNISSSKIPKSLTVIPGVSSQDLMNRDKDVEQLRSLLNKERYVAIFGVGGTGKSTVKKLYASKYFDDYDHIMWLNAGDNIVEAIGLDENLHKVLGLGFQDLSGSKDLKGIFNALNQIEGNNLMLIDNCNREPEVTAQLTSLRNWKVLLSTRVRQKGFYEYRLANVTYAQADRLFHNHYPEEASQEHKARFFGLVDYNVLAIELAAKTIANSIDIDLSGFLNYLENQQLDDLDLEIDVELDDLNENVNLFSFLDKTFKISGLTETSQNVLEFLALLPSENVDINDLVDIAGPQAAKQNKVFFVNAVTELVQKGLVDRNGSLVNMHRLLQETIIYRLRKEGFPFGGSMFLINWLIRRFDEGFINDPSKSLRFLKYGVSILKAIKEPYRTSMYQPLLRLENEVLHINNTFISVEDVGAKWHDLEQRASRYLPQTEPLLGAIRINYGAALAEEGDDKEAIKQYQSAMEIFRKNLPLTVHALMAALTNLSMMYIPQSRFNEVNILMGEIAALRKAHNIPVDQSLVMQLNALAHANQKNGDLKKASEMFKAAVDIQSSISKERRNDSHLVRILKNYSLNLLMEEKPKEAIAIQRKSLQLAESLNLYNTSLFRETLDWMYTIYLHTGHDEDARILKAKYVGKYF